MMDRMPFADYDDFDDCVAKNRDKDDPEAYCGKIKDHAETADEADADHEYSNVVRLDTVDRQIPSRTFAVAAAKSRHPSNRRPRRTFREPKR